MSQAIEYEEDKAVIHIKCEQRMRIQVTFLSQNMIRCESWQQEEKPKRDSYMSAWEVQDKVQISVKEEGEQVCIQCGHTKIAVDKMTGLLTWCDKRHILFAETRKGDGLLELETEKTFFWGLGQQQDAWEGYNGRKIELIHKNTSITVPFLVSNQGYTILWNSSAAGVADFTRESHTSFESYGKDSADYLLFLGSPMETIQNFWKLTGPAVMLPKWSLGFWQSKMRYTSQDEILAVAEKYREKEYPVDIIVVDFYHWTQMGDFAFEPENWPHPEAMMEALGKLHIKCMVSVWPHISTKSFHYEEMGKKGYLVRNEKGNTIVFTMFNGDDNGLYDPFSAEAREFLFEKARGYYEMGARVWWLDGCEPDITVEEMDEKGAITVEGSLKERVLAYPLLHARTFYEGQRKLEEEKRVLLFARSSFAGAQKYGICVWSGDIGHDFAALRCQIAAGLSASVSGLPFWTTDIGGFTGGNPEDDAYRELYIRWFQYGTFCPIFRVHGSRGAQSEDDLLYGISRGENELWSFGAEAEHILAMYDRLRYILLPYIYTQVRKTVKEGVPVMQPLFLRHCQDELAWGIKDQYYFGEDLMICPIVQEGAREREVYLPGEDGWYDLWTGTRYTGDSNITIAAEIDRIPVFVREHAIVPIQKVEMYVDEKKGAGVYAAIFGETAAGDYYNDDGDTYLYEKGEYEEAHLTFESGEFNVKHIHPYCNEAKFRVLKGTEIQAFIIHSINE